MKFLIISIVTIVLMLLMSIFAYIGFERDKEYGKCLFFIYTGAFMFASIIWVLALGGGI